MKKIYFLPAVLILFLVIMHTQANTAWAGMGGFQLSPVIPDNQTPGTFGFFNLNVESGARQRIYVEIINNNDEPIFVEVRLFTVGTNINGILDYTRQGITNDTLLTPFEDIAALGIDGEELYIPANTTIEVPVDLSIPDHGLDGLVLGAIHVLLGITEEERAGAGMIVNRFAQVIPIRLHQGFIETDPDFELGDINIEMINFRAAIIAEVHNPLPQIVLGVNAGARIYPRGTDTPIFARGNVSVDFAPNGIFGFSLVDEAGFGLHPGDYTAVITLTHHGVEWEFVRDFEILEEEANRVNDGAVNQQQQLPPPGTADNIQAVVVESDIPWLWIAIGAGAFILLVLILIIIIMLLKNKGNAKLNTEMQRQMQRQMQLNMEKRLRELGLDTNISE